MGWCSMSWNYRVVLHDSEETDSYVGIHECYYDEGEEVPHSMSKDPLLTGEDIEDLRVELSSMLEALEKPVIEKSV